MSNENKISADSLTRAKYPLFDRNQMGDGGSTPTSALQLFVKPISKRTAELCYKMWHYLGDMGFISTINFGAYFEGECLGAISYGAPNATELKGYFDRFNQNGWWEIKRLAMSDDCPKNSESRFIAISIKELQKFYDVTGIVTYADDGIGHSGTIYRASNFEYLGLTDAKCDFYVDGKIQQRGKTKGVDGEWRKRSRKHLFIRRF